MAEFGITFNGRDYEYRRYRYGFLADAVAYAKLRRCEPLADEEATDLPPSRPVETPTLQQRTLMAELDISFSGGIYRFAGFRYNHLADAVHYARRTP